MTLFVPSSHSVPTPLKFLGRRLMGARLSDMARGRGGFADDLITALEERALWSRYGL